jgi:hypothetical protein
MWRQMAEVLEEVMEAALSRAVEQGQPLAKKARIGQPTSGNVSRPGSNMVILSKQISTESLAILVHSYHKHFADYSRSKTRVMQRVPAKVWKILYADFKEEAKQRCIEIGMEFDESCLPAERTLQDGLRAALDPTTGVSDPAGATKVVPQSEEVLMRLKQSDSHARRVILRHREDIVAGVARRKTIQSVPMQDEPDKDTIEREVSTTSDGMGDERSAVKTGEQDARLEGQFVSNLRNRILRPPIPHSTLTSSAACLLLKASQQQRQMDPLEVRAGELAVECTFQYRRIHDLQEDTHQVRQGSSV